MLCSKSTGCICVRNAWKYLSWEPWPHPALQEPYDDQGPHTFSTAFFDLFLTFINIQLFLKGTVSQDFWLLVFKYQTVSTRPLIHALNIYKFCYTAYCCIMILYNLYILQDHDPMLSHKVQDFFFIYRICM
jgi:hypothetical protein